MKTILSLLQFVTLILILSVTGNAQIKSQWLNLDDFNGKSTLENPSHIFRLSIDEKLQLLREDSLDALSNQPFRFGKGFMVDIDMLKAGGTVTKDDHIVISYSIFCENAYSVNLIFDRIKLDSLSELNIFDSRKTFVYGPINSKNIPDNNILWTDLIPGESVIIELTTTRNSLQNLDLHISDVIYGYKNTFYSLGLMQPNDFGDALACHNNIICPAGAPWAQQGDAVAMMMLANGSRFCSGSILNNQKQDYTPYFLTAFHCLDGDQSGVLSTAEKSAPENYLFRFKYNSPTCTPSSESTCYISYNTAYYRAGSQPSDFVLLRFQRQIYANEGIPFLGWDRSGNTPTSGVVIHHPIGDVKKISFDNNNLVSNPTPLLWDGVLVTPTNSHW